jgi:hypothetical protein
LPKIRFLEEIFLRTNEKGRGLGMGGEKKSLFRRSESPRIGAGIGYSDIRTICEGNAKSCEKPDTLK